MTPYTKLKLPKILILPLTLWSTMHISTAQDEEEAVGGVYFSQAQELMTGLTFINGQFVATHQLNSQSQESETDYSNFDINDPSAAQNALGAFASMDPSDPRYNELLARLNQAIDQGTIGREDIDSANLPNHDLYFGNLIALEPLPTISPSLIEDYLGWYAVNFENGDPSADGSFSDYLNWLNNQGVGDGTAQGFYSMINSSGGIVGFLTNEDSHRDITGLFSPNSPLAPIAALPDTLGELATFSKALRSPDARTIFDLMKYRTSSSSEIPENIDPTFAETWTQNIDWEGVNTSGFDFERANLSNSNITGAQISSGGRSHPYYGTFLTEINANGINMAGFNPTGKIIQYSSFNSTSNVNPADIIKADDFSYTSFVGATKPNGTALTKTDLENAINSQYSGANATTKLSQLNTVSF